MKMVDDRSFFTVITPTRDRLPRLHTATESVQFNFLPMKIDHQDDGSDDPASKREGANTYAIVSC